MKNYINFKENVEESLNLLSGSLTQEKIIQSKEKLNNATNIIKEEIEHEKYEIPYVNNYYYKAKQYDTDEIVIKLYITDYYQKEVFDNINSLNFKLIYELDGVENIINTKGGDYNLHLGKLTKGHHWFSFQVQDELGRLSIKKYNDIWIVNAEEYDIKESEIYTITEEDLSKYGIKNNNSTKEEDMVNTRDGLTLLFNEIKQNGYRKCILPFGTYRIKEAIVSLNNVIQEKTYVQIPSNFTVDLNNSTIKQNPFDDREYYQTIVDKYNPGWTSDGDAIGKVGSFMVCMDDCVDSHLINGVLEGDFSERKEMIWSDGTSGIYEEYNVKYNGEHVGCFHGSGCEYCTLENITITNITGYNSGFAKSTTSNDNINEIDNWINNLNIVNGVEVISNNYSTTNYIRLTNDILDNKYIYCSRWLGYGGMEGIYWDMEFHFYDKRKKFIKSVKTFQYDRCMIPDSTLYVRITFKCEASKIGEVYIHTMKKSRYNDFINCKWIDNRTCSASTQFSHLSYQNCTFTRSGQSITPTNIDMEDGWQNMQDLFLIDCDVLDATGSTCGLICCAGLNYQIINCSNLSVDIRYATFGVIVKNSTLNTHLKISVDERWQSNLLLENITADNFYITVENNPYFRTKLVNCSGVVNLNTEYEDNIKLENQTIYYNDNWFSGNFPLYSNKNKYFIGCDFVYLGGDQSDEDITPEDVLLGTNSTIDTYNGIEEIVLTVHGRKTRYVFSNGTKFMKNVIFNSDPKFYYLLCKKCFFYGSMTINLDNNNKYKDIQFIGCVFKGDVTINTTNTPQIYFKDCKFEGNCNKPEGATFINCNFKI